MALYSLLLIQFDWQNGLSYASAVTPTPCPPPPPRVEWPTLTSVTRDDAVDGGPWIGLLLNNSPLLSLLSASLHPVQVLKSHLRLIHGSMILDHIRTWFLRGDLYARATYMRVYTVVVFFSFFFFFTFIDVCFSCFFVCLCFCVCYRHGKIKFTNSKIQ